MKAPKSRLLPVLLAFCCLSYAQRAAAVESVQPELVRAFENQPLALQNIVITFDHLPTDQDIAELQLLGVTGGIVLQELPMVLTRVDIEQFRQLRKRDDVISLYANQIYTPYSNASRAFIGVDAVMYDAEVTAANGGLPVTGQGIGVAYIDTGIDATHPDLELGASVVQNVYFPLGEVQTGATGIEVSLPAEFVPPLAVEDQLHTDIEGGHGTFGAAIVAGSGEGSGGFYGGVAPGAKIIGLMAGNDLGLTTFSILQAYDYALANQFRYNIRVANNSFGADLGDPSRYDPYEPVTYATKELHDRFIAVVVAAGNSGDTPGAINALSVAPWVISVAAGDKQARGTPAGFSSRGEDDGTGHDTAGQPADPMVAPNFRPDITAPGNDIKSARSSGAGVTNTAGTAAGNDTSTIPPAFLPRYTTSQGTSFAAPHVAGVIALMLQVNPSLTPDEIITLLRASATPMPPFSERTVGAGYVDAHNAVRVAMGLAGVAHRADLTHVPGVFQDPQSDNSGTTAHDILAGSIRYDAGSSELVYELTVRDMAPGRANHRWTQELVINGVTVFVSAERTPLGDEFEWGTLETDPATGINNQTNHGALDAGTFDGSTIRMHLGVKRIAAAIGAPVVGAAASGLNATSWTLVGSSATGGLLLAADTAGAAPFVIADSTASDDTDTGGSNCDGGLKERLPGRLAAEMQATEIIVKVRCPSLHAQLNYHPGNQAVAYELRTHAGEVLARGGNVNGNARQLHADQLPAGEYVYRISGSVTKDVEFVIRSVQQ